MAARSMTGNTKSGRRIWMTAPALIGVGYTASWVVGLSIWSSSTKVRASGAEVLATYGGHEGVAMAQYLLTEGLPALGLGFVAVALGRRAGQSALGRAVTITGLVAAVISFVQFLLGVYLTGWSVPDKDAGAAGSLLEAITRLDGVKMLLLGALALTGTALARTGILPRRLGYTGVALAIALAVSGIGYLFLLSGPALAAWVSLPLLLVWVTGACVVLGRTGR
jgi:hypothetical protein